MNVIVPLNKKVVVEPESKESVSKGGIIIPETANQKAPTKGRIISIAEDSDIRLKLAPGDIVLFSKYSGIELELPDDTGRPNRKLLVIKDEDILAVVQRVDPGRA